MRRISTLLFAMVSFTVFGQQVFTTNMNASYAIPQTDAVASAISSQGMLAAQDQGTSTIIWYNLPVTGTEPSDITIAGGPVGGLAWSQDGNKLIISENGNLKIWDSIPTSTNQLPDITTPYGYGGVLVAPDGRLIVSHISNDFIYIWNTIPTVSNQAPDLIYGGTGTANNRFARPWGMGLAPNGMFFVAEESNNRVLGFDSIPASVSDVATVVLGQANFTSSASALTQTGLGQPLGVTVTIDGKIAVSEFGNDRVTIWNTIPTTNGAPADAVLGQTSFTTTGTGTAMNQMNNPYGISTDFSGRIYVSGREMDRVMVFGTLPNDIVDLALTGLNTSTQLCNKAEIVFKFDVDNLGPDTAKLITVIADLPSNFNTVSSNPSMGTYNMLSGYWDIPQILNGATATLTITGTVDTVLTRDTIVAVANIQQAYGVDTVLANNIATVEVYLDTLSAPNAPVASNKATCINTSVTLTATSGNNVRWYGSQFASTTVGTGNSYTTPTLTSTATYYVEAYNGCVSPRIPVTVTVDPCTGVDEELLSNVKVYPNPASHFVNIEVRNNINLSSISIVNILGEKVNIQNNGTENIIKVDVSDLDAGIYFVVVEGDATYKLIVK